MVRQTLGGKLFQTMSSNGTFFLKTAADSLWNSLDYAHHDEGKTFDEEGKLDQFMSQVAYINFDNHQIFISYLCGKANTYGNKHA